MLPLTAQCFMKKNLMKCVCTKEWSGVKIDISGILFILKVLNGQCEWTHTVGLLYLDCYIFRIHTLDFTVLFWSHYCLNNLSLIDHKAQINIRWASGYKNYAPRMLRGIISPCQNFFQCEISEQNRPRS